MASGSQPAAVVTHGPPEDATHGAVVTCCLESTTGTLDHATDTSLRADMRAALLGAVVRAEAFSTEKQRMEDVPESINAAGGAAVGKHGVLPWREGSATQRTLKQVAAAGRGL